MSYLPFYYRGQPKAGTGYKMLSVPFVFSMSRFQGPANLLLFRLTLRNLPKQCCVCFLKVSPVFRKLVTSLLKQKMKCKQYSFHGNRLNRFQKLWKSTKIARKYGKNKVILIILRLKFLKTRAPCAIGTSLPELQFFSQKNICDKIDFHIARQTWWCKQPLCMLV